MYFLLGGLRRFHDARDVAWYEAVGHGLFEGLVQGTVDIVHGARSEPRIELLTVQPPHVGWGKGLEFRRTALFCGTSTPSKRSRSLWKGIIRSVNSSLLRIASSTPLKNPASTGQTLWSAGGWPISGLRPYVAE